jgi:hypothetical protein
MKKIIVVLLAVVAMSSCQSYTSTSSSYSYSSEESEMSENIGTDGFIVKPGDTLWEFSKQIYGRGTEWREILKENPFLSGRVELNKSTGKWIVTIYPGESIIVRGRVIYPSSSSASSASASATFSFHQEEKTSIAWWVWMLISIGGAALIAGCFVFLSHAGTSGRSLTKDASIAKYRADRKVWEMNNETIRLFITSLRNRPASYNCRIESDGTLQVAGGDICPNPAKVE